MASDAFETLTALLVSNKAAIVDCLNPNRDGASLARYGELFTMYNRMLQSDNYVLKRQSLKLLSELLLDRQNFAIMMRYIVDKGNLRIIMGLLRHNQPNIQFEAFHVFKVRARPGPPPGAPRGCRSLDERPPPVARPFATRPPLSPGLCRQPGEARRHHRDPRRQQGAPHPLPARLPERQG